MLSLLIYLLGLLQDNAVIVIIVEDYILLACYDYYSNKAVSYDNDLLTYLVYNR